MCYMILYKPIWHKERYSHTEKRKQKKKTLKENIKKLIFQGKFILAHGNQYFVAPKPNILQKHSPEIVVNISKTQSFFFDSVRLYLIPYVTLIMNGYLIKMNIDGQNG